MTVATSKEALITTTGGFAPNISAGATLTMSYGNRRPEGAGVYVTTDLTQNGLVFIDQRSWMSMGTVVSYMDGLSFHDPDFGTEEHPPFGRNRKERRTLDALPRERLSQLIRKVEKAEGPRDRNQTRWNAAFWNL